MRIQGPCMYIHNLWTKNLPRRKPFVPAGGTEPDSGNECLSRQVFQQAAEGLVGIAAAVQQRHEAAADDGSGGVLLRGL